MTRRKVIGAGLGLGAAHPFAAWLEGCAASSQNAAETSRSSPANTQSAGPEVPNKAWYARSAGLAAGHPSTVAVAVGLRWYPIVSVGDRPFADPGAFVGTDHDFTAVWPLPNGNLLLWVNHESHPGDLDDLAAWSHLTRPPTPDDMRACMGASVLEIALNAKGEWAVVYASARNWRLSGFGPATRVTGPAVAVLGPEVVGTMWNCGGGTTPWGTVLTCEENFRYQIPEGLGTRDGRIGAEGPVAGDRIPGLRGEHYGWVVEVDPMDSTWVPRRHTALGRMRHESAAVVAVAGQPLRVYMADDRNGGGIWRFTSRDAYAAGMGRDAGTALLESGTLAIAGFDERRGRWITVNLQSACDGAATNRFAGEEVSKSFVEAARSAPTLASMYESEAALLIDAWVAGLLAGGTGLGNPEGVVAEGARVVVAVTRSCDPSSTNPLAHNPERGCVLEIMDQGETFSWRAVADSSDQWGNPDNLALVEGGLLLCTDSGRRETARMGNNGLYYIAKDQALRLLQAPPGAEVAGPSFSPDGQTLFMSIQHPDPAWGRSTVVGLTSA